MKSAVDSYHQIFYPDKQSTQVKVQFVKNEGLGGLALWALGYEGEERWVWKMFDDLYKNEG